MANLSRRNFLRITGVLGAAAGLSATISACAPDNPNNTSSGGSTAAAGSEN